MYECGWYKIISGMIVVGSWVINFVYIKYINSLGAVIASFVPTNGLHPSKNPIFTFRLSVLQKSLKGMSIKVCHTCESHHTPKNIVPCIKIRYSVKKFSRLLPSRQATLASKIPCTVVRDVQLYRHTVVHTQPTVQGILEAKVACLESINLENFFTEYLIFMHGTIFLGVWCDSQE